MLPFVNLDDETYEEIFEHAKRMIPKIYPEWTDFNAHDPGITFLQLFAWFKEMQQFHLNQIGDENRDMFLKLIGMEQRRKQPASTLLSIYGNEQQQQLVSGTRFFAGGISFETIKPVIIEYNEIVECESVIGGISKTLDEGLIRSGRKMRFLPFGTEPKRGDRLVIKFRYPFEEGKEHSIYFDIFDDYEVKRNPIQERFYPLAEYQLEYYTAQGYQECVVVQDDTERLLQSGLLTFLIPERMEVLEDGTYAIRLTLTRSDYDCAPLIQGLSLNVVPVQQICTHVDYQDFLVKRNENGIYTIIADSVLSENRLAALYHRKKGAFVEIPEDHIIRSEQGMYTIFGMDGGDNLQIRIVCSEDDREWNSVYEMNGFPNQVIELNHTDIVYDSFELFVEDTLRKGAYRSWQKVRSFDASKPEDCHYVFDEEHGRILFGDCEHGRAPEGKVRLLHCVTSLGAQGNVKQGQIQAKPGQKLRVQNTEDVSDGRNKESIEECFERFREEFHHADRAVTEQDYEELVRNAPGLRIRKVSMIGEQEEYAGNSVTMVVQPFSYMELPVMNPAYEVNIRRILDERRLLGTKVEILSPDYVGIIAYIELVVKPQYVNARTIIERRVEEYFETTVNEFGIAITQDGIYGLLDSLDCVTEVRNVSLHALGHVVARTAQGDLQLPGNGLAYLKHADYMIMEGEA